MPRINVGLPNCREGKSQPPGSVTMEWMREIAVEAEALGCDGVWLNELVQLQEVSTPGQRNSYYDPIVTMSYLAAITKRIRFVTATIILPHHHPVLLSRQIATLDVASGGRLTLGIGIGGQADSFRALRGDIVKANRGAMMDEYLAALRLLWEQPRASFSGQYVKFEDAEAYPKPLQQPLPIFMAGNVEGSVFERIARFGQGWIDSHNPPAAIDEAIAKIAEHRAALGVAASPIGIARQFYVSIAPTREDARAIMAAASARTVPTGVSDPDVRGIIGTPDDVVQTMQRYLDAGVTELAPIFYGASLDVVLGELRLFAREVMPALRERTLTAIH
jgi:probable F420-dependent oxidoreductase